VPDERFETPKSHEQLSPIREEEYEFTDQKFSKVPLLMQKSKNFGGFSMQQPR